MHLFKNIPFYFWCVNSLYQLRHHRRNIDRYRKEGNLEKERDEILAASDFWGNSAAKRFGVNIIKEGLENIPEGPVLFVSNHQSYIDIIVILATFTMKQTGFVAKEDLRTIPVFGKWIERIRSVFLQRDDSRAAIQVFKTGEQYIKDGFSLVVFPEGTRSHCEEMGPFRKGSLRLATKTGVPVVPITLSNDWKVYEEHGYMCPADVRLCVHPAIETASLSKTEIADLSDRVEAIIRKKLDEWNASDNN